MEKHGFFLQMFRENQPIFCPAMRLWQIHGAHVHDAIRWRAGGGAWN